MRNILGSLFLVLALFGASYKVTPSKSSAFVKEPIVLELFFSDPRKKEIVWIKFAPKKSSSYEVHLLSKQDTPQGFLNRYLIFPLKSKEIEIDFDLRVKYTTQKELQKDILGTGYEQTKIIEGVVQSFDVEPLKLYIKEAKAQLYGDFTLNLHIEPKKVKSFEPVYATLHLRGRGYPPPFDLNLTTSAKLLADKPQKEIRYTPKGALIDYTYRYALISDRNFTIEPLRLSLFDYHSYKELRTPPVTIVVTPHQDLLDTKDIPPPITPTAHKLLAFFQDALIFLSGFLSAFVLLALFKSRFGQIYEIISANEQELLALLATRYPNRYHKIKKRLSQAIQTKKSINLLAIKFQLLKDRDDNRD